MARITLDNVTKRFGAVTAVQEVSLTIEESEFFALLGPSGCGKTTTLRLIAGLETPDAGRILIDARDVTRLAPRKRDVAMVFQDYALYPHMIVMDNIGYPLKVRGVPKSDIRARVTEVAKQLQIGELLDRRPGQLSGGQQQRASVARAVVHKPQVFLFDEPLSNLDAKLRLEARAFLKHLQREVGVTTIYVTHDQAEALALADRVAIINEGRVIQIGPPLEVYRRPATTFVADFIGSPPMNLVPCRPDWNNRRLILNDGGMALEVGDAYDHLAASLPDGEMATLGIRPEHIRILTTPAPASVPARVYVTQPLGSESLVVVELGESLVSVRLFEDQPPELPERVWLAFDLSRAYLYGPDGSLVA
jgi:multiple sugar transport system ATP-binding protein